MRRCVISGVVSRVTHLLARCHVLHTIKCHASSIGRPIYDPARTHTHARTHIIVPPFFLSPFFSLFFIYLFFISITHLHISLSDPAIYRSRLPAIESHVRTHIHTLALLANTRNIISARDDPTFLRLHVGLRMRSVRNSSVFRPVPCHVINRVSRHTQERTYGRLKPCLSLRTAVDITSLT